MAELSFEVCPETGIASITRGGGNQKVDLMPDEVLSLRDTGGDLQAVKAIIAESDSAFAASLTPDELAQIAKTLG